MKYNFIIRVVTRRTKHVIYFYFNLDYKSKTVGTYMNELQHAIVLYNFIFLNVKSKNTILSIQHKSKKT